LPIPFGGDGVGAGVERARLFGGHFEEDEVGELFDKIAVGEAVVVIGGATPKKSVRDCDLRFRCQRPRLVSIRAFFDCIREDRINIISF
jgi:hypothetical protein